METMDLTKTTPRSVRESFHGVVQLARTTDKAKALAHGNIGEYDYNSPMDQGMFRFLGVTGADYLTFMKNAKTDAEIDVYVQGLLGKKSSEEIQGFNKQCMTTEPTGESLEHFRKLRMRIAPDRTDVTTWPDLLDLEEGRTIAHRETAKV